MSVLTANATCDKLGIQKEDRKQFESDVLNFFRKYSGVHLEDANFDGSMMLDIALRFITTDRGSYYFGSSSGKTSGQNYDDERQVETLRDLLEIWNQRTRGQKPKDDPSYSVKKASKAAKTAPSRRAKAKQTASASKRSEPTRTSLQQSKARPNVGAGPSTVPQRVGQPLAISDDSEGELTDVWELIKPSKRATNHEAETNPATKRGAEGDPPSYRDRMEPEQCPEVGSAENMNVAAASPSSPRVVAAPMLTPPASAVRGNVVETGLSAKIQEWRGARYDQPVLPTPIRATGNDAIAPAEESPSVLPGRLFSPPSTSNRAKRPAPDSRDADDVTLYAQESHTLSPYEGGSTKRIRLSDLEAVEPHGKMQPQRERSVSAEAQFTSSVPIASHPLLSPSVPPSLLSAVPTKAYTANAADHSVLPIADNLPSTLLTYVERVQEHMLAYTRSKNLSIEKVEEAKTRCKFLALLLADLQSRVKSAATGAEGGSCSELSLWI